jgi:hypothetical protein
MVLGYVVVKARMVEVESEIFSCRLERLVWYTDGGNRTDMQQPPDLILYARLDDVSRARHIDSIKNVSGIAFALHACSCMDYDVLPFRRAIDAFSIRNLANFVPER